MSGADRKGATDRELNFKEEETDNEDGILGLGCVVAVRVTKITSDGQSERGAGRVLTRQYVTAVFGGSGGNPQLTRNNLAHAAASLSQDTV